MVVLSGWLWWMARATQGQSGDSQCWPVGATYLCGILSCRTLMRALHTALRTPPTTLERCEADIPNACRSFGPDESWTLRIQNKSFGWRDPVTWSILFIACKNARSCSYLECCFTWWNPQDRNWTWHRIRQTVNLCRGEGRHKERMGVQINGKKTSVLELQR